MAEYVDVPPEQQARVLGGAVNAEYLQVVLLYKPPGAGPAPPAPPHALVLEVGDLGINPKPHPKLQLHWHGVSRPGSQGVAPCAEPTNAACTS